MVSWVEAIISFVSCSNCACITKTFNLICDWMKPLFSPSEANVLLWLAVTGLGFDAAPYYMDLEPVQIVVHSGEDSQSRDYEDGENDHGFSDNAPSVEIVVERDELELPIDRIQWGEYQRAPSVPPPFCPSPSPIHFGTRPPSAPPYLEQIKPASWEMSQRFPVLADFSPIHAPCYRRRGDVLSVSDSDSLASSVGSWFVLDEDDAKSDSPNS
nr:hypothetical protein [Sicyoidochytrium minutum DNA virus]